MRIIGILFFAFVFITFAMAEQKTDLGKTGVGLSKIALPNGPGSIEGLGGSFEPQLNSGTASYSIDIKVPSGTAGLQPSISLLYNSGIGNGPFGLCWNWEPMSIKRKTSKGIPTYGDGDIFVFNGVDLVPLSDGSWRQKIENKWVRITRNDNGWVVQEKNGTIHRLGLKPSSCVSKGGTFDFNDIFAWYVTETEDVHGNVIEWEYTTFVDSPGRIYPSRILWGAAESIGRHSVNFIWESREDSFTSCVSGFSVTTGRRCKEIRVESEGHLVRRYELSYNPEDGVDPTIFENGVVPLAFSLLRKVEQRDNRDHNEASSLPPLRFGYSQFVPSGDGLGKCFGMPPFSLGDANIALADCNGDSLPDVLRTDPFTGVHEVAWNLGRGIFTSSIPFVNSPSGLILEQPGTVLLDVDGDSRVDILQKTGDDIGNFVWFPNMAASASYNDSYPAWGAEQFFLAPQPQFNLNSADVRSLDLNGDKRIDWMRTTSAGFIYWLNRGNSWEERGIYLFGEPETGDISFADDVQFANEDGSSNSMVELADMNGDGLLDLVRKTVFGSFLEIDFWPNLGNGAWGHKIEMSRNINIEASFKENIYVVDVNRDGISDVVVVSYNQLDYWINLGNLSFSKKFIVSNTPEFVAGKTVLRFADVNGNGTTDFVWENWNESSGEWVVEWFDFSPRNPPNLLVKIDNGLGVCTSISYTTTTDLQITARENGTAWNTRLPFPLTVVSQIIRTVGVDFDMEQGEDYTQTDILYSDGWYDAFEREFCGFAFAEKKEKGDEFYPSVVVRTAFHVGIPDGIDNDADGFIDEYDEFNGREEEPLKGLPLWEEITTAPTLDSPQRVPGVVAPNGEVFSRTETKWQVRTLHNADGGFVYKNASGDVLPNFSLPFSTRDGRIVQQTWASEILTLQPEANESLHRWDSRAPIKNPVEIRTEIEVDYFGNEIFRRELGTNLSGDERFTKTDYTFNFNLWILGHPYRIRVTDANGAFASEQRIYYDGEEFVGLPLGVLGERGLQMRVENLVNDASAPKAFPVASDTVGDPRLPAFASVTSVSRNWDRWGNIIAERDGAWEKGVKGHERRFEWDSTFHSHIVREIIEIDQDNELFATAEWDFGGDVILSSKDLAGNETTCLYDSFWRPVGLVKSGDTIELPTLEWSYLLSDPVRGLLYDYASDGTLSLRHANVGYSGLQRVTIRSREISGSQMQVLSHSYTDGMGREYGTVSEASVDGGWIHNNAVCYSRRGGKAKIFSPFESTEEDFCIPVDNASCVELWYDAIGREIRSLQPPETEKNLNDRAESLSFYLPLEVEYWDPADTLKGSPHEATPFTKRNDGIGQLITFVRRIRENNVVREINIQYGYDAAGRLIRVVDPLGNVRLNCHDGLGRRIFINDSNAGTFERVFDGAGNVLETRDARGAIVKYSYDGANRILSEDWVEEDGVHPIIRYWYDKPSKDFPDFENLKGRLSWVEDKTGAEFCSYSSRGLLAKKVKRIIHPATKQSMDFCFAMEYDAMDRVVSRVFPDKDKIEIKYDARGLIKSIPGILDSVSYMPNGAPRRIENVNGTIEEWTFDLRQRISRIRVLGGGTSEGISLLDSNYKYDRLSNITSLEDKRDGILFLSQEPQKRKFISSKEYEFDGLSRLKSFRNYSPNNISKFEETVCYSYDVVNNLIKQESTVSSLNFGSISYGGSKGSAGRLGRLPGDDPGPNAIVATDSGERLNYDDAGNIIQDGEMVFKWDTKGRLSSATNSRYNVDFSRDWTGRRIWKHISGDGINATNSTVLYVDSDFQLRDGLPIKSVFRGSIPIARFTERLSIEEGEVQTWIPLRKGWNLVGIGIHPKKDTTIADIFGIAIAENSVFVFDQTEDVWRDANLNDKIFAGDVIMVNAERDWLCELDGTTISGEFITLRSGVHPVAFGRRVSAEMLDKIAGSKASWTISSTTKDGVAKWITRVPGVESSSNDLIEILPSAAVFVKCDQNVDVKLNDISPDAIRWYHCDAIGSTDCITGRDGSLRAAFTYWPNGEIRDTIGFCVGELTFTGKEFDNEIGMYHFEARAMNPRFGSFASPDPLGIEFPNDWIGDALNLNIYAYAARNPIFFSDIEGKSVTASVVKGLESGNEVLDNAVNIWEKLSPLIVNDKYKKIYNSVNARHKDKIWIPRKTSTIIGSTDRFMKTLDNTLKAADNLKIVTEIGTTIGYGFIEGQSGSQMLDSLSKTDGWKSNHFGEFAYWTASIITGMGNGRSFTESVTDAFDHENPGYWSKIGYGWGYLVSEAVIWIDKRMSNKTK